MDHAQPLPVLRQYFCSGSRPQAPIPSMRPAQGSRALRRLVGLSRSALPTPGSRAAPLAWRGFAQQASAETAGKTERPPWLQNEDLNEERPPWLQNEAGEASKGKEASAEEPAAEELSPVERLEVELEELQETSRAKKKELLLALADFENNKKKYMKERETRRRYASVNFATRMVGVYSEFEELPALKVLEGAQEGSPVLSLQEGVSLTRDLFAAAMDKSDVEKLSVEAGTPVVKTRHEVVGSTPGDGPDGSIAEVIEAGWVMDLRSQKPQVLRKAKVKTVGEAL